MSPRRMLAAGLVMGALTLTLRAQSPDTRPVLYLVATSHLDSQWNWTVQDSIRTYVPATFFDNFKLFERHPGYTFSYEGAIHYMWFKEHYPEAWPTLQEYVRTGRWRVAGNWINAVDVNVPSPESLMRHALIAKRFFRKEFGKVSHDVYLPDCFGFGFALPSIARHSGLTAFTTQKLTWGSSVPIPFPLGRWRGVDGSEVVAALDPHAYDTHITSDISVDPKWLNDPTKILNGRPAIYRLFGTGDIGGAPDEASVAWLDKALANPAAAIEVRNTSVDQFSRDLSPAQRAALPVYEGELTMKTHGVGTYSSQAAMKKFNRQNELLADSAERAAVAAAWAGGLPYPADRLRDAWTRFLWHQFHDDITGTSIPQAYQFSWNDELVSSNQFAGVLQSSIGAIAARMDTRGAARPLVVYNPMAASRLDLVEAAFTMRRGSSGPIDVVDLATNRVVPSQVLQTSESGAHVLFLAGVQSISLRAFDVRPRAAAARPAATSLKITPSSIENARLTVRVDANGDISSVIDREAGGELLSAPVRLEMRDDPSPDKPAWRILWETVNAQPREYVQAPEIRIVEQGPVRATLEITRKAAGSTIIQRVSLTEGGGRVDVVTDIDWKSTNTLLKAAFPLRASNPKATFDLGLGTIQRGNGTPDAYEVPAQWWADITDASGAFGAAVLTDSKYGWDKPADNVLRLTLLHTPKPRASDYQASQDLGRHRFAYSIAGHPGDWRSGRVPRRAANLNVPLVAFQVESHPGPLGRDFSLLWLTDLEGQIAVRAIKKAEDSDEIVVRIQELHGKPARTILTAGGGITSAREINAAEEPVGALPIAGGRLTLNLKPYQPRTLAIRFSAPAAGAAPPRTSAPVTLPFNLDGISSHANRADGDIDGKGTTIPAEQWPRSLQVNGVRFALGPTAPGAKNVLVPDGRTLNLPTGPHNVAYVLASAVGGDETWAGDVIVRDWEGPIGQWYSPLKSTRMLREVVPSIMRGQSWTQDAIRNDMVTRFDPATGTVSGIDDIRPAFVKPDEIAWVGTHRHDRQGDQIYIPSYVFLYAFDLPPGSRKLILPDSSAMRIFAISVANEPARVQTTRPLYSGDLLRK